MTSKNLFFSMIKQEFQRRIWCPLLIFLAGFLTLEVQFLIIADDMARTPSYYAYTLSYTLAEELFTLDGNQHFLVVIVASAVICGLSSFCYLNSRRQIDVYHSLPVKRDTFYFVKYAADVLFFMIPLCLHCMFTALAAAMKQAWDWHALSHILCFAVISLLVFLLVESVTVLAVCLTGNMMLSIAAAGILLTYSLIISLLRDKLFSVFFYTNVRGYNTQLWAFSPIHMLMRLLDKSKECRLEHELGMMHYQNMGGYLAWMALAFAIFFVIGLILYRVRPSEMAGRSIAFAVVEPVLKFALVLPLSIASGLLFRNMVSGNSFGWFVFGVIMGFLICSILIESIFRLDIKQACGHVGQFLFNAACLALIVTIFESDVLGYNTFVPSDQEVASCGVSIDGLFEIGVMNSEKGYMDSIAYRMKNMAISDNPSILALARKAAAQGIRYEDYDYYEGIEDTQEYQDMIKRQERYQTVTLCYQLHKGKQLYRHYVVDMADEETLSLLADIFNDTDYKVGTMPVFKTGWSTEFTDVTCRNGLNESTIKLDAQRQKALLEAYQSEFMKLTFEDICTLIPIGSFDLSKRSYGGAGGYHDEYNYVVYPTFTRTIALLQELDFDMTQTLTADMISSITIYDYQSDMNKVGEYPHVIYTEEEQIAQILDNAISSQICYSVYNFLRPDSSYSMEIKDNKSAYASGYYDYYFMKDHIPDFVEKDMKEVTELR